MESRLIPEPGMVSAKLFVCENFVKCAGSLSDFLESALQMVSDYCVAIDWLASLSMDASSCHPKAAPNFAVGRISSGGSSKEKWRRWMNDDDSNNPRYFFWRCRSSFVWLLSVRMVPTENHLSRLLSNRKIKIWPKNRGCASSCTSNGNNYC